MRAKPFILSICLSLSIIILSSTAWAATTPESTLVCGSQSYTVSGFGRGTPLHVSGTNSNYVVTYAEIISGDNAGDVVINNKGHVDKANIVTCTVKSPLSNRTYLFKGFFTPNGTPHDQDL